MVSQAVSEIYSGVLFDATLYCEVVFSVEVVFVDFVVGVTFQLHHPFPVWLSTGDYVRKEWPSCGIVFYSFSVGNSVAFMPQAIKLPLPLAVQAACSSHS